MKTKVLNHGRQDDLGLHHGEIGTHTDPWSGAERQILVFVAPLALGRIKPGGIEFARPFPQQFVPVQRPDWQKEDVARTHPAAAQFVFLQHGAGEQAHRRIKPHSLFQYLPDQRHGGEILGPSGAGKSTLLSLTAGFLMPTSGEIRLNGEDHRHTPPAKRPVSMLFQENNLFSHLTVRQNMGLGLHPGLKLTPVQQQELLDIAHQVGLETCLDRLPSQLSGGQRQRVALARCLLRSQPILLLDEPFSALDPALRSEMLNLLDKVCQERHLTLLMVSHNLDDAARVAQRTLLIVDGRIYYDGPTQALVEGSAAEAKVLGIPLR